MPIGKRITYFELDSGGNPTIVGTERKMSALSVIEQTPIDAARARAVFQKLPEKERQKVLGAVRKRLEQANAELGKSELKYMQDNEREFMEMRPPRVFYENISGMLKRANSVMEIDVVWERNLKNRKLKELLEEYYKRKRQRLLDEGKIEP